MKLRALLLLGASLLLSAPSRAETLREVLQQNNIPATTLAATALDARVSSGAAAQSGDWSYVAYPSVAADETLGPPLHVVAYNRATQKLLYRAVAAQETSDECFGAVWDIHGQGGFFLVTTHINPSALCTVVLDADLRVRQSLVGWPVAPLGPNQVLLEEDEVHFAPVHPLRLEVAALDSVREKEVYPPDGDPLRAAFSRDLRQHLPPQSWCQEHDHPCDPGQFDEGIAGDAASDAAGAQFAFVVTYDATSFGDEADRLVGTRSTLYVYRKTAKGWAYCQQALPAAEAQARQNLLKADFEAATSACTKTSDVTVKPVDSAFQ